MLDPMIDWHVNVLARTLYGMARGEEDLTRDAFAALVMNRCAGALTHDTNKRWGLTIADVCLKPGVFECWDPDSPNRSAAILAVPGDLAFMECFLVAFSTAHGFYVDHIGGADSYKLTVETANLFEPSEFCETVGQYDFYRTLPEPANDI